MTCELTREWLLNADQPADLAVAPREVTDHISQCTACRQLQADVVGLEQRWRELPLHPRSEAARASFLLRLQNPPVAAIVSNNPQRRRWLPSWVVAASLFLIVAGIFFYWPSPRVVEARADVLDDLIEWNLQISEAPTHEDRKRLYHERNEALKRALRLARLNQREQELGESLLDNGAWMADNDDLVEELSRYHMVAGRLLEYVTISGSDANQSDRFAKQFRKVNERGIDVTITRIKPEKFTSPEHNVKFNRLLREDADRAVQIIRLMEKAPDLTKKELKKAMDLSFKRRKHQKIP